ncbi:hypothetical protein C4J81_13910 [Deltaproteobacteria bacterium Smac51]|nr:hypothetical protein C4J81_13910 [Deltaproteobacteria bacterium Smac51]
MRENESLWRLARKHFESLLSLEVRLAEMAEADGPAARLARRFDELKAFGSIFEDFSDDQPDVRPFIEALRRALDDLPGGLDCFDLSGADQWQTVVSYLKELQARVSTVCESPGHCPKAEVSESAEVETSADEPAAAGEPETVETEGGSDPAEAEFAIEDQSPPAADDPEEPAEHPAPAEPAEAETSPKSLKNLSEVLPGKEGPIVYFLIKLSADSGNDQKTFSLIKMLLDKALPIMGETGKHFFYPLDLNLDKSFSVVEAQGDRELTETLGLAVTIEEGQIVLRGTPLTGFDGPLHFSFARIDHVESADTHRKPMYIAADPRTLWQDLPVEDFEGYPADNETQEARPLPETNKIVVAASCRGRSHAHAAKPRDDSFLIDSEAESGWNFVAVADGAGSSRFSRQGSRLACETVVGELKKFLQSPKLADFFQANQELMGQWKEEFEAADGSLEPGAEEKYHRQMAENCGLSLNDLVYRAIYEGYKSIEQEAQSRQAQVRDYHTTLICAAFKKFSFGFFFITYWVGDGAMALYDWNHSGRVLVPGIPDGGEFAGQTRFLTMGREEINPEAVSRRTRYIFAENFESLILATDGITDPFFPSEKSVVDEARWHDFWSRTLPVGDDDAPPCPELFQDGSPLDDQALALRRWLNFWSKGNHDDRTILIVK